MSREFFAPAAVRLAPTLASNGAVTLNAANTNSIVYLLQANATSSTITNGVSGQSLTITWKQDGTGSRTYAWPVNCKFAGAAAPAATTTANRQDRVTFEFDGTNWYETGRAINVG